TLSVEASLRDGADDGEFQKKAEEQVTGIAQSLRNPKEVLRFKMVLAARAAEKGDLDAAARAYRDGIEIARAQKDPTLEVQIGSQLVFTYMERDIGSARKLVDELVVAGRGLPDEVRNIVSVMRVMVQKEQGDLAGARRELDDVLKTAPGGVARANALVAKASVENDARNYKEAERVARAAADASALMAPLARVELAEALIGQRRFLDADAAIKAIGHSPMYRSPRLDLLVAGM